MPLYPVATYSSWQLACIAAVEPMRGTNRENVTADGEIRAELRLRGKSDAETEKMISFAKQMGRQISPVVCMDVDDLSYGISVLLDSGAIDAARRDTLIAFIATHTDLPREARELPPRRRRYDWIVYAILSLGFYVVAVNRGRGFWIWITAVVFVVVAAESHPTWWLRRLKAKLGR